MGAVHSQGASGGPERFTSPHGSQHTRDGTRCLWKAGWQSLLRQSQEASWRRKRSPTPRRPEGGGQVGPGQGGGFRGLGEGGQPRPPASQQWQLGGLQQVSELTPNVGHPQGRSPSSPPSAQGSKAGAPDSLEQAAHRVGWCRESPRAQETQRMAGQLAGIQKVRGG